MIRFLLTSWWFYIPIIAVLLFLTRRNQQRIKKLHAQKEHEQSLHSPRTPAPQKDYHRIKKAAGKFGIAGVEQGEQNTNIK